jgi:predicted nucleotidyltransferase component of viral defense system
VTAARTPKDVAASVRARLLELSRRRGVEFQLVLSEFAIERLLYRLGVSPHADRFVLKGAMLLKLWARGPGRATWDLDLLGRGDNAVDAVAAVVRDLCEIEAADGIVFDPRSIAGEEMRADEEYAGVRIRLVARLAGARIPVQIDVGFGDAVVPPPGRKTYPTLLDHPAPWILVYPREAVVAEKLEAIVTLGTANTRMKDFYDVNVLASAFSFDGDALVRAVRATFERRGSPLPETLPHALSTAFLGAPEQEAQWRAFVRRSRLEAPPDGAALAAALQRFLGPVLAAASSGEDFRASWAPGGPWRPAEEVDRE